MCEDNFGDTFALHGWVHRNLQTVKYQSGQSKNCNIDLNNYSSTDDRRYQYEPITESSHT